MPKAGCVYIVQGICIGNVVTYTASFEQIMLDQFYGFVPETPINRVELEMDTVNGQSAYSPAIINKEQYMFTREEINGFSICSLNERAGYETCLITESVSITNH